MTSTHHGSESAKLIHEARRIVADLRRPNPRIYWTDLALSASIAWGALLVCAWAEQLWIVALATIVAGLALTRALLFVHEITHLRAGSLPGFRLAWNVVVGVPFLAPSFTYETVHVDHHRVSVYRTAADPEHAPDNKSLRQRCAAALLAAALVPLLFTARWLVLGPLSILSPRLRSWVLRRASGITTNPHYRPTPMKPRAKREALLAEGACFVWTAGILIASIAGWIPIQAIVCGALALSIAAAITDLRGEILHRFSSEGSFGTLERQVRDSVNVPHSGVISALLLPIGIGYHALHHLDMALPYHAMPEAHARLMNQLPAGSLYHRVTAGDIVGATEQVVRDDLAEAVFAELASARAA